MSGFITLCISPIPSSHSVLDPSRPLPLHLIDTETYQVIIIIRSLTRANPNPSQHTPGHTPPISRKILPTLRTPVSEFSSAPCPGTYAACAKSISFTA